MKNNEELKEYWVGDHDRKILLKLHNPQFVGDKVIGEIEYDEGKFATIEFNIKNPKKVFKFIESNRENIPL